MIVEDVFSKSIFLFRIKLVLKDQKPCILD